MNFETNHSKLKSPADFYAGLDAVTPEDLQKVAQNYLAGKEAHWLLSVATRSGEVYGGSLEKELKKILE